MDMIAHLCRSGRVALNDAGSRDSQVGSRCQMICASRDGGGQPLGEALHAQHLSKEQHLRMPS